VAKCEITVQRWAVGIKHSNGDVSFGWSHAVGSKFYRTREEARQVCRQKNATPNGWHSLGARYIVGRLTMRETFVEAPRG